MTNTFIPTLSPHPLYCVWIKTGNPARPLECVWIDPQLRSFEYADVWGDHRMHDILVMYPGERSFLQSDLLAWRSGERGRRLIRFLNPLL
jgi:hypothetical protein